MFSAGRISLRLIGCSGHGGCSVDCFDWLRMGCAVDFSHGEDWIGYIRTGLWTDSLIDGAPVTGSLLDSALSDCLIELCIAGFSSTWTFCSTDSVLLAGLVLSVRRVNNVVNMAADDAALVEARAGVTFGVELYVPWDAPEAVVDVWMESRVLQGRDARSVRVLVPDCRGVDQNFHDVTIVDMGDMPESPVYIPVLSTLSQQWPLAVLSHMGWRQKELEEMRSAAKVKFRQSRPSCCEFCGSLIKSDMYRHVAHLPGRARLRTAWITCVEPTMFRGRSSRLALRSLFRRGQFPGSCGRILCLLSTPGYRRMCYCLVTFICH